MFIKLHEAHISALPAAKQEEEEKMETPLAMWTMMGARCFGAVGSSLKLEVPLKCRDKEHSKN